MILSPEEAKALNLIPGLECYDNSTLSTIDSCVRKAYWKFLFPLEPEVPRAPIGVAEKMGPAAHFGSAIHLAMAKFYSPILYRTATYENRKLQAFKAFSLKYHELFPDYDLIDEPYTHTTGVCLLDDYFNHYEYEDTFYRPIETELCIIVLITDIEPWCYWISRPDGLIERVAMQEYLIREFKTTKSGLQNKIDELRISRQPQGYVWSSRHKEFIGPGDLTITGFMADVIAVRVRERNPDKLFVRDIFNINEIKENQWYRETLTKIQRWREIQRIVGTKIQDVSPLLQHHFFDRNTNECLRYGKCSYYELCLNGPSNTSLQQFLPNDWNPLYADKPTIES